MPIGYFVVLLFSCLLDTLLLPFAFSHTDMDNIQVLWISVACYYLLYLRVHIYTLDISCQLLLLQMLPTRFWLLYPVVLSVFIWIFWKQDIYAATTTSNFLETSISTIFWYLKDFFSHLLLNHIIYYYKVFHKIDLNENITENTLVLYLLFIDK